MSQSEIYSFSTNTIDGKPLSLSEYKGKVLLIVNVASKCGFTGQYEGLQELYDKYKGDGLVVLGFPCNQFSNQEPGNEQEIKSFCSLNYNVTFPMFQKVDVNGNDASPLYQFLKKEKPGVLGTQAIKWNFTKFLVGRDGKVLQRFAPKTEPDDLEGEVLTALRANV